MRPTKFITLACVFCLVVCFAGPAAAQVLGGCGTPGENEPAETEPGDALIVAPVPLPGHRAINFELPAVLEDDIKNVKLSDYNGKWRVVCFYPADFTFV